MDNLAPEGRPVDLEAAASTNLDTRPAPRTKPVCPTCGQPKRAKRSRGDTTDEQYRRSMHRQLLNYSKRIREGGPEALADAVALRDTIDAVINAGIEDCRSEMWSASWAEIAAATNVSRQAAQQKWSGLGGVRRRGGQPSWLR